MYYYLAKYRPLWVAKSKENSHKWKVRKFHFPTIKESKVASNYPHGYSFWQ